MMKVLVAFAAGYWLAHRHSTASAAPAPAPCSCEAAKTMAASEACR